MTICALLTVCLLLSGAANAQTRKAAFASAEGKTLTLSDEQGHPVAKLTVPQGIGDFAIDSSGHHVVVQTPGVYGGQLLWCIVTSGKCEQLTHGPYYYTSDKEYREVYAAPSFSPDDTQIAFAIRSLFRKPDWAKEEDAIEAEGPLAVMTIKDKAVRILKSTTGKGACFTGTPLWSPNGSKILFACEEAGGVTDLNGTRPLDILDAMEGPPLNKQMDMSTTQPLAWDGNNAILFSRSRSNDPEDLANSVMLQLDLAGMRVHPIKEFGGIPTAELRDVWQIQKSKRLVFVGKRIGEEQVYNRQTGKVVWSVHEIFDQYVPVQLIGDSETK
jgi:hypothetical protein